MEQDFLFESTLNLECETEIRIDESLKEIRYGIDLLVSRVLEKNEKLVRLQLQVAEIEDKLQFLNEFSQDPGGFSNRRNVLEPLIVNQKSKNLQILSENDQLSLKISELEQTINNNNLLLSSNYHNKKYLELESKTKLIREKIEANKIEADQESPKVEKIKDSIKTLSPKIKTIKEKSENLIEIKESLISKLQKCDENIQIVEGKIKSHQSEEQNLAEKLFIAKREAEEALLSFQRFKFRLASVFRQEYTILITKSSTGLLILLHSNKQEIKITKEIHCSVFLNKKRPNRFYLTTGKETREFESEEASKIVKFLNLAIQLNSEEESVV